ncbi:MAG: hypothetical protein JKY63_02435 [Rhodobiaceae bacterium]|nr:hypothetical protein [Rhodobiaceae bacterium]
MYSSNGKLRDDRGFMVDQKLVHLLGGRPWVAAIVVAAGLFASFWALAELSGIYEFFRVESFEGIERTFGMDPYTWAALVTSLLTGFAISASSFSLLHNEGDLREAAPALGHEPDDLIEKWIVFQRERLVRARVAASTFYLIGLGVALSSIPGTQDVLGLHDPAQYLWYQQVPAAWFLLVVPLNFSTIGKSVYFTVAESVFLGRLRDHGLNIDLFQPERLRPFNRLALRESFLWIVGTSIGLLFFLNSAIKPESLGPFLAAIMLIAFATLMVPLYGIHLKIVAAKRAELRIVRDVIVELKDQFIGPRKAGGEAAQRLVGAIAYEARLEKMSDWSIDLPTMGKFSFYLVIPVVSWVGGALVERVVDAVL